MTPFLSFQNSAPSRKPQTLASRTNVGCTRNPKLHFTYEVSISAFGYFLQICTISFLIRGRQLTAPLKSVMQGSKILSSHICHSPGRQSVLPSLKKTFSPFLKHHEFWRGGIKRFLNFTLSSEVQCVRLNYCPQFFIPLSFISWLWPHWQSGLPCLSASGLAVQRVLADGTGTDRAQREAGNALASLCLSSCTPVFQPNMSQVATAPRRLRDMWGRLRPNTQLEAKTSTAQPGSAEP